MSKNGTKQTSNLPKNQAKRAGAAKQPPPSAPLPMPLPKLATSQTVIDPSVNMRQALETARKNRLQSQWKLSGGDYIQYNRLQLEAHKRYQHLTWEPAPEEQLDGQAIYTTVTRPPEVQPPGQQQDPTKFRRLSDQDIETVKSQPSIIDRRLVYASLSAPPVFLDLTSQIMTFHNKMHWTSQYASTQEGEVLHTVALQDFVWKAIQNSAVRKKYYSLINAEVTVNCSSPVSAAVFLEDSVSDEQIHAGALDQYCRLNIRNRSVASHKSGNIKLFQDLQPNSDQVENAVSMNGDPSYKRESSLGNVRYVIHSNKPELVTISVRVKVAYRGLQDSMIKLWADVFVCAPEYTVDGNGRVLVEQSVQPGTRQPLGELKIVVPDELGGHHNVFDFLQPGKYYIEINILKPSHYPDYVQAESQQDPYYVAPYAFIFLRRRNGEHVSKSTSTQTQHSVINHPGRKSQIVNVTVHEEDAPCRMVFFTDTVAIYRMDCFRVITELPVSLKKYKALQRPPPTDGNPEVKINAPAPKYQERFDAELGYDVMSYKVGTKKIIPPSHIQVLHVKFIRLGYFKSLIKWVSQIRSSMERNNNQWNVCDTATKLYIRSLFSQVQTMLCQMCDQVFSHYLPESTYLDFDETKAFGFLAHTIINQGPEILINMTWSCDIMERNFLICYNDSMNVLLSMQIEASNLNAGMLTSDVEPEGTIVNYRQFALRRTLPSLHNHVEALYYDCIEFVNVMPIQLQSIRDYDAQMELVAPWSRYAIARDGWSLNAKMSLTRKKYLKETLPINKDVQRWRKAAKLAKKREQQASRYKHVNKARDNQNLIRSTSHHHRESDRDFFNFRNNPKAIRGPSQVYEPEVKFRVLNPYTTKFTPRNLSKAYGELVEGGFVYEHKKMESLEKDFQGRRQLRQQQALPRDPE